MAKRYKNINEGVIDKLLGLFLSAKSQGKESNWISRIRKTDPELADVWADMDATIDKQLQTAKRGYERAGKPEKAKEIDAMIARYKNR
jgi:hypothetical protein